MELMSRQEVVPLLDDGSLTSVLLGSYMQSTTNMLILHAAAKKYTCIYNNLDLIVD